MTGTFSTGEEDPEDEALAADAAAERASLRDALALEDAGELRAAARLFEYVGEHDQAAALRLEHAATTADADQRLGILRDGASRNRGESPQGRALHLTLARALLEQAAILDDGATRRGTVLEAARSLELAQRGAEAGRIYEELGLLTRAERAYRDAGDIERYEAILERLEDRERAREAMRTLRSEVASAVAEGRRSAALDLLRWHADHERGLSRAPDPELTRTLDELERRLPRRGALRLRWEIDGRAGESRYVGRTRLRIGRGPENNVIVPGPSASRRHATFSASSADGRPTVVLTDLGSRAGTFVNGDALDASRPEHVSTAMTVGIGMAAELGVRPHGAGLLLQDGSPITETGARSWLLFAPGEVRAAVAPGLELPASIWFAAPLVLLRADAGTRVSLGGRGLGFGATIELLVGDRIEFGEGARVEVIG